ncbi:MAG: hypothetical protein LBB52_03680 [Desulfovibrio sp.]|nr:hypothetical protein [Desulfovibrio sp.]
MKTACVLFCCLFFGAAAAGAAVVKDETGHFSLDLPEGWDMAGQDFSGPERDRLAKFFDCLDAEASELRFLGWRKPADGASIPAAFCVTYRPRGAGKAARILRESEGKRKEEATAGFINVFVARMQENYARRGLEMEVGSADLIEAGEDLVLILEAGLRSRTGTFRRSSTVFLHDDALLEIGAIYTRKTPVFAMEQLDALPQSLNWLK